ncbi:MAG: zinc ribbon domain-containing protein [Elusimicrobiota bacterium]
MNCPKCGGEVLDDDKFCRQCGTHLLSRGRKNRESKSNIGAMQDNNSGHCPECGGKVEELEDGQGRCRKCKLKLVETDQGGIWGDLWGWVAERIGLELKPLSKGEKVKIFLLGVVIVMCLVAVLLTIPKLESTGSPPPPALHPKAHRQNQSAPITASKISERKLKGREEEAIELVKAYKPPRGKRTVEELLGGAVKAFRSKGFPDRLEWTAEYEDGATYHVEVAHHGSDLTGRAYARAYAFHADLRAKSVVPAPDVRPTPSEQYRYAPKVYDDAKFLIEHMLMGE